MLDALIENVPWWAFVLVMLLLVGFMAYLTFVAGTVAPWMFWGLLGVFGVGAVVGIFRMLVGGGV